MILTLFIKKFNWGVYEIEDNFIIAQYCNHTTGMAPIIQKEFKFRIIDSKTLELVKHSGIKKELSDHEKVFMDLYVKSSGNLNFVPTKNLPPPNCWLKEKDWFWCDNKKLN